MNQTQEFIKEKTKNWKEKRFGSSGELIVYWDEVEKWLDEYAERKVKNLAQPDVSGSLPSDEVMQRMGDVQDIFDGRIECTECNTKPMTSREDGLCDQCRERLRQ